MDEKGPHPKPDWWSAWRPFKQTENKHIGHRSEVKAFWLKISRGGQSDPGLESSDRSQSLPYLSLSVVVLHLWSHTFGMSGSLFPDPSRHRSRPRKSPRYYLATCWLVNCPVLTYVKEVPFFPFSYLPDLQPMDFLMPHLLIVVYKIKCKTAIFWSIFSNRGGFASWQLPSIWLKWTHKNSDRPGHFLHWKFTFLSLGVPLTALAHTPLPSTPLTHFS